MADVVIASDESGNFDFSGGPRATKYLIVCTVTGDGFAFGDPLLNLRRALAFEGRHLTDGFHATTDPQAIRDRVFAEIPALRVRADATILEKAKAQPHLRGDAPLLKMAWWLHFKYVVPRVLRREDRLLAVVASVGTKKSRGAYLEALRDVVRQVAPRPDHQVAFWRDESEPCLWVADYVAWAVQRKWESADARSYDLIAHLLKSEFDAWASGSVIS